MLSLFQTAPLLLLHWVLHHWSLVFKHQHCYLFSKHQHCYLFFKHHHGFQVFKCLHSFQVFKCHHCFRCTVLAIESLTFLLNLYIIRSFHRLASWTGESHHRSEICPTELVLFQTRCAILARSHKVGSISHQMDDQILQGHADLRSWTEQSRVGYLSNQSSPSIHLEPYIPDVSSYDRSYGPLLDTTHIKVVFQTR